MIFDVRNVKMYKEGQSTNEVKMDAPKTPVEVLAHQNLQTTQSIEVRGTEKETDSRWEEG